MEENFRVEPNGALLGRIRPGTAIVVETERGGWIRASLEGWIWGPSLEKRSGRLNVAVSAAGGENLRAEPNGRILARVSRGTLLQEVERRPGWVRVRRTGWIWAQSVARGEGVGPARPAPPATRAVQAGERPGGWVRAGGREAAVLTAPDGDTLARVQRGAQLQVLARQGNWARVRIEGWTWLPGLAGATPADTAALADVGPRAVASAPERYRGRLVAWRLQFISLERAEKVRTDFYEGEPFLLARSAEPDSRFVYVAVPPERVSEVEGLAPLEWVTVVGRVRTGAAALTGSPILDLLELRRTGRGGAPDAASPLRR